MGWLRRLRNTLLGSNVCDDFNEEARFHLEQRTEENLRRGMSDRDARAEATRRFGNMTLTKERTREVSVRPSRVSLSPDSERCSSCPGSGPRRRRNDQQGRSEAAN